ncbi:MAG: hypothetical protein LBN43_03060, partial [Oscillospiraceae bacterium]|nr:hypothetical protein [Oscillospiraceae bacterium]
MKILRILAAALTFVLLTTCAANKAEPTPGVTDAPETPPDQEMVWVPEFIALPREVTDLFRPMMIDGAVYFTMSVKVGTRQSSNPNSELDVAAGDSRYDIFENQVFKINPDGSGFERADTFPAIYADDSLLSPEGFDISPIIELGYAESELYPLGEIEGGRILVANRANTEFITLRLVPAKSVKPKIELTMAAFTLNQNIREAVTEFNRVNQEYAIIVTEYNDIYDTSRTASVKLNTEIAAGVIPDIFALYMMPYDTYANKGLLEDLRPYLDAETEIVPEIAKLLGTS